MGGRGYRVYANSGQMPSVATVTLDSLYKWLNISQNWGALKVVPARGPSSAGLPCCRSMI